MHSEDLVNKTRETWQPFYEAELSNQELGEITHNVVSLVNLLNQWKQKEVNESSNTNQIRRIK